jgi:hypothetical protein
MYKERFEEKSKIYLLALRKPSLHLYVSLRTFSNREWWYTLGIPRLRQEECEFQASLGDIARSCFKKKKHFFFNIKQGKSFSQTIDFRNLQT